MEKGILFSLAGSVLIAAQYPLIRLGVGDAAPISGAILESFFILLLSAVVAVVFKQPLKFVRSRAILLSGLFNSLALICLFESLSLIHPGLIGMMSQLYLVYALLMSHWFFKEVLNRSQLALMALTIIGVFLVVFQGDAPVHFGWGFLLGALFPALFTIQNAVLTPVVQLHNAQSILFSTKVIALPCLTLYAIVREGALPLMPSAFGAGVIFASTLLAAFLGLGLFYQSLKLTTFALANIPKAIEPVLVLAYSALLFPMTISSLQIAGVVLTMGSIAAISFTRSNCST